MTLESRCSLTAVPQEQVDLLRTRSPCHGQVSPVVVDLWKFDGSLEVFQPLQS